VWNLVASPGPTWAGAEIPPTIHLDLTSTREEPLVKTLLTVALCLLAVPVLAASPAPTQAPAAPATTPGAPAFVAALMPAPLAEATTSTCTADCKDGTTLVCTGTSCTARDTVCRIYQRGQCWSDTGGYQYCPLCPCDKEPHCADVDGSSCPKPSLTTICYEPSLNCRQLTCSCSSNHQWLCP